MFDVIEMLVFRHHAIMVVVLHGDVVVGPGDDIEVDGQRYHVVGIEMASLWWCEPMYVGLRVTLS